MARLPRLYISGCARHTVQRGNNRESCIFEDADNKAYLHHLKIAAKKYQVSIHAFVLMSDHAHPLATPSDEKGISLMMPSLGRSYVKYLTSVMN